MCFQEYIGYACGHATIKILRPCPLTTHLHTNPVCSNAAERPTQVNSMCPSCARILHVRWVEIITLEHQWMHERGVCGCPVVFPALQEPRAIGGALTKGEKKKKKGGEEGEYGGGGGGGGAIERRDFARGKEKQTKTERGGAGIVNTRDAENWYPRRKGPKNGGRWGQTEKRSFDRKGKRGEKGKGHSGNWAAENNTGGLGFSQRKSTTSTTTTTTKAKPNDAAAAPTQAAGGSVTTNAPAREMARMPHATAWDALAPIVQITHVDEERTEVAVRLSSMYGAEWIPDHGALHRAGECGCLVSFDTYKPHLLTEDEVDPFALAVPDAQLQRQKQQQQQQQQSGSGGVVSPPHHHHPDDLAWRSNPQSTGHGAVVNGVLPTAGGGYDYASVNGVDSYFDAQGASYASVAAHQGLGYDQGTNAYSAGFIKEEAYSPSPYGVPYDQYTQHTQGPYTRRSTVPPQTEAYLQARPHGEIVAVAGIPVYQQPDLPLAGWPIGAGPEFGTENSHSPKWDMCRLSRPKLKKAKSWCL